MKLVGSPSIVFDSELLNAIETSEAIHGGTFKGDQLEAYLLEQSTVPSPGLHIGQTSPEKGVL